MLHKNKPVFKIGDIVVTIVDEKDIVIIPKGTVVTLTKINSELTCSGRAEINAGPRSVMVFQSNLVHKNI